MNSKIRQKEEVAGILRNVLVFAPESPEIDDSIEIREEFLNNNFESTFEPTEDSIHSSDESSTASEDESNNTNETSHLVKRKPTENLENIGKNEIEECKEFSIIPKKRVLNDQSG